MPANTAAEPQQPPGRRCRDRRLRLVVFVAGLAAVVAATLALPAGGAAHAGSGQSQADPTVFVATYPYRGGFPDPTILRIGSVYYAASTTIANLNLPMMSSTDLRTWTAHPPLANYSRYSSWRMYNEAMLTPPPWAYVRGMRGPVRLISQWAPSLAQVRGRYLAAFSAATRAGGDRHSCIGVSTAATVVGPYTPASRPLVCFPASRLGVIDPDFFTDSKTGHLFLLWKQEGIAHVQPPALMIRELAPGGTRFAAGSRARALLQPTRRWEGGIVENPSMVRYRHRYLLFYSGGPWATARYATGYAVCRTPFGRCRKVTQHPLLTSQPGGIQGPGGADAFTDTAGRLRLAYAAYNPGSVGTDHDRRLHIATLSVARGRVVVTRAG